MKSRLLLSLLALLSSCYRFDGPAQAREGMTLSVPYVPGDVEGQLTNALVRAVASSSSFRYVAGEGNLTLKVAILSQDNEKVGYRYLRENDTGARKNNLVTTEARKQISAEISVVDSHSQEVLFGPIVIHASTEYDFIDPTSVYDLVFTGPTGAQQATINFSLGQLDSNEGAQDDALVPLYRNLAQQIVDTLQSTAW